MNFQRRDKIIHARLSSDEVKSMHEKMESLGVKNESNYIRKMVLNGYCISFDTKDIKELVYHLRRIGNNLNQYAKRANEDGSIYAADIEELKTSFDAIWQEAKEIIERLATVQ